MRELLQQELCAAGYEVDTLSSGTGFTEDMVGLVLPDLLLVDPFLNDVSFESVTGMLTALHAKESFKLVLIDSTTNSAQFARVASQCHAEGVISKRDLLRSPADAVAEQFLPEVEVMEVIADEPKRQSAMSASQGNSEIELSVDLGDPRPPPGPKAPVRRAPPVAAAVASPPAPTRHPSITPPPPPAVATPTVTVSGNASRAPSPPASSKSRAPPPPPADSGVPAQSASRAPPPAASSKSRAPPPPRPIPVCCQRHSSTQLRPRSRRQRRRPGAPPRRLPSPPMRAAVRPSCSR